MCHRPGGSRYHNDVIRFADMVAYPGSMTSTISSATVGPAHPDILGSGYEAMTIELADDAYGPVVATLVRRRAATPASRAVLYVHGYVDYFFQTGLADFHVERGSDFYALDLRRYGRSIRPGQTPWQIGEISDYNQELDAALAEIVTDGHDAVTVIAHSTGGLIVPMWLADRADRGAATPVDAVVLNSPFLEVNAHAVVRLAVGVGVELVSRHRPTGLRPLPLPDPGWYGRSIHTSMDGEWDFDLDWKPLRGVQVQIGWLAAIRRAHRRLAHNLGLTCPILSMSSTNTFHGKEFSDAVYTGDAVLDADRIADMAPRLGHHVTVERIGDGMHDLFLSRPAAREVAYQTMGTWLDRYGR